ncbi:hypothetical protein Nepgr_017382 [Nepenthes gracilis]|uniref:Uncharacterized protein n=1 Tax=Nepenthes gracilis TaxID=150966 RepID=A0AAD3XTB1_NEPGR|nr:hypothetical protein Nepgr_017382 [Nepenthes gracilis]
MLFLLLPKFFLLGLNVDRGLAWSWGHMYGCSGDVAGGSLPASLLDAEKGIWGVADLSHGILLVALFYLQLLAKGESTLNWAASCRADCRSSYAEGWAAYSVSHEQLTVQRKQHLGSSLAVKPDPATSLHFKLHQDQQTIIWRQPVNCQCTKIAQQPFHNQQKNGALASKIPAHASAHCHTATKNLEAASTPSTAHAPESPRSRAQANVYIIKASAPILQ